MSRTVRARGAIAAVFALAAAGCQNYNFNPVGHCLVQPGSQSFTLSNLSTADVLFVVDDSNSMAGKQARLASAFDDFVQNLTSTNQARAAQGLVPIDFHIATTTTSVFYNPQTTNQTCQAGCAGANGKLACCVGSSAQFGPKSCKTLGATTTECPAATGQPATQTTCSNACTGLLGGLYCCNADGSFPSWMFQAGKGDLITCSAQGLPCGQLQTHYDFAGQCPAATQGVALDSLPFPDGAFVGSTNVAAQVANPRVLHFDKRLYYADAATPGSGKNAQGFTLAQLKTFFKQNVAVGTCGSAQEQGLVASRHAVEKALAAQQKDSYRYDAGAGRSYSPGSPDPSPATFVSFSAPNGIPAPGADAVWPNPSSKLVVVWVGDEDDCSSPADPSGGVVLLYTDQSGADACVRDSTAAPPLGGKETVVSSFVDYFTGLGRSFGAAFVISARSSSDPTSCSNGTCLAQNCCDLGCDASCPIPSTDLVCGGQAPGARFLDAASSLNAKGADVVVGSVCSDFGPLLQQVAEVVKPPQTLSLPTLPSEAAITILRIATPAGETRKICGRPLAPAWPVNYATRQEAEATGADWWFTKTANPDVPWDPSPGVSIAVPTQFVYINPSGDCKANPGETYSADYLGVVPAGGCVQKPEDFVFDPVSATTKVAGSVDCQDKLGAHFSDWECYVPPPGPPVVATGTCTCRSGG